MLYAALHLRGSVKPWFMQWLEREHPELVPKYRSMYYGNNAYAPKAYRRWLGERIRPLIRAHGLERGREDPVTGGVRSSALAGATSARQPRDAARVRCRSSARSVGTLLTLPRPIPPSAGSGRPIGPLLSGRRPAIIRGTAIIRWRPRPRVARRERRITMTLGLPGDLARDIAESSARARGARGGVRRASVSACVVGASGATVGGHARGGWIGGGLAGRHGGAARSSSRDTRRCTLTVVYLVVGHGHRARAHDRS